MTQPELRVLTDADATEFWAVRLRGLREDPQSFGSSYEESVETPLDEVARRLSSSPDSFVMGAFAPNLVGVVGCHREERRNLHHKAIIWGMYVTPEWRGRSVGRALLEAAILRARQINGLEQLLLQVVIENTTAFALYRSLGFKIYGTEIRSLQVSGRYYDEYLMMLELTRPHWA